MNELFDVVHRHRERIGLRLNVSCNQVTDWTVEVSIKPLFGTREEEVLKVSGSDRQLVFAKAHVRLKEWLSERIGGY